MTAWTRLEHHRKFWEVRAEGAKLFIRFGKIGTDGQTRLKQLGSAGDATAEIAKLVAGKEKEGFARTGKAKAVAQAAPAVEGPQALGVFRDIELCAVWRDGADVWIAQMYDDDEPKAMLRVGASLAEAIWTEHGAGERWRFDAPKEAERAAAYLLAHAGKKTRLSNDTAAPVAAWSKRTKVERPRIPRLEPGKGPITLTVDTLHDWIYPRPPSTSCISKRVMVPVLSLVGPIDPRFGKRTGVFLSACPTGEDLVFELVVQDPAKPSTVDAYFETYEGVHTIHLSMQVQGGTPHWAVTEHICTKGTNGHLVTEHAGKRAAAEKLFAERVAAVSGERVKAPPKWYRQVLAEIDHHHRHAERKPSKTTMRAAYGAYVESIAGSYATPSRMLERASHFIGGTPRFCQEEWDFLPKNPCGKAPVLYLFTLGRGDLGWTEILNDGDLGALTFFAAPGDPFGTMEFSCH